MESMQHLKWLLSPSRHHTGDDQLPVSPIRRAVSYARRRSTPWKAMRGHNHTLPIARLPSELLLEILMYCAYSSPECLRGSRPWGWHAVAQVCHDWRQVALSCPILWANINLNANKHLRKLFLARSRTAPITLRCEVQTDLDCSNLQDLLGDLRDRLRTLDLQASRYPQLSRVFTLLGECSLTTLSVVGNADGSELWLPDSPFLTQLTLPKVLVGRLCRLSLQACAFEWNSPLYSTHITSLELIKIDIILRPSATQLFAILASAPNLETLALVEAAPVDIESCPDRFISLPFLRSLRLDDSESACLIIITSILFPPKTRFQISCSVRQFGLSVVTGAVRCFSHQAIFTAARLIKTSQGVDFQFEWPQGRMLDIELRNPSWNTYLLKLSLITITALRGGSLENITELELHGLEGRDQDIWKKKDLLECRTLWWGISGLRQLRVLKLVLCRPLLLIETLFEHAMLCIGVGMEATARHIGPDGASRQLLQQLATIRFINFNFEARVAMRKFDITTLDLLTGFLWALERHGSPAPILRIENAGPGTDAQRINQLRQFTKVVWNGSEGGDIADASGNYTSSTMQTYEQLVSFYRNDE